MINTNFSYYLHKKYLTQINNLFNNGTLQQALVINNELILRILSTFFKSFLYFLQKHSLNLYSQLIDIATYDRPWLNKRFVLNYNLHSFIYSTNIIVSIQTDELKQIPSSSQNFSSAI